MFTVADLGFFVSGGGGRQDMILPNFHKNCKIIHTILVAWAGGGRFLTLETGVQRISPFQVALKHNRYPPHPGDRVPVGTLFTLETGSSRYPPHPGDRVQ